MMLTVFPVVAYFCARPRLVRILVLNVALPMLAGYYLVTLLTSLIR